MDQVKFWHLAYPSHNGDNPLRFSKGNITKHAAASTVAAVRSDVFRMIELEFEISLN